ncbi:MAG TPA: prepilin-type N-terminal cleavage/methylation domain-containing protein [Gemmatimonadaceae bacterium]|nr:prepilin-type N-terminal cleavage/methylation domain-containing protein [Gemmatimonadaceae bacterium]
MKTRRGFTMVELSITLVLVSLVVGGLFSVMLDQQRFYSGASDIIETRTSVREIADVLPSELRALAPAEGDIYQMSDRHIRFRATTGATVACAVDNAAGTIIIPPVTLSRNNGLTAWITRPARGDSVLIFDPGVSPPVWRVHILSADPTPGVCAPFTANAAEANNGLTLNLNAPIPAGITMGASLRFFRASQYELYQASDGKYYLGFYDCIITRSPVCATIQPVSGPYLPYAATGPSGLRLTYFNSANAITADRLLVARIDVVARAESRTEIRGGGRKRDLYRDSTAFSVAVRNQ